MSYALTGHHGRNSGEDNFIPEVAFACQTQDRRAGQGWNTNLIAPTLHASNGGPSNGYCPVVPDIAHSLRADGFDASEDGTGRGTPLVPDLVGSMRSNGDAHSGFEFGDGIVATFDERNVTSWANRSRVEPGQPCHTLHADPPSVIGSGVRRLTPRECERLQGFPDNWTLVPYRGKSAADGPRYKAIGNSMAVPVVRWIGERIQLVDAI